MLRKFVIWDSKASPEEPAEMLRPDMEECPEKYAGREASRIEAQFLKEWEKGGLRDERAMLYPHLENPVFAACCHDESVTGYRMIRLGVVRDIVLQSITCTARPVISDIHRSCCGRSIMAVRVMGCSGSIPVPCPGYSRGKTLYLILHGCCVYLQQFRLRHSYKNGCVYSEARLCWNML